jgi:hypothetical protein
LHHHSIRRNFTHEKAFIFCPSRWLLLFAFLCLQAAPALAAIPLPPAILILPAETAAPASGGEIVVGLLANTSGDYAMYGNAVKNGAMLCIDEIKRGWRRCRQTDQGDLLRREGDAYRGGQRLQSPAG